MEKLENVVYSKEKFEKRREGKENIKKAVDEMLRDKKWGARLRLYSHIGSENNNDVIEEAINFINDKIKEICNIGENSSEKEKREFKNEYNRDIIEGVIKEKLSLI